MQFRCSGATVTLHTGKVYTDADIRRTYRAYRQLLGLSPEAARRRLVFTQVA